MILRVLARQAATRGDRAFLRHEGRDVTYAEFDRLSNRAAHALRGHGVERGDRVTLACGNSLNYVVAAFGVLKAGGVLHPINPGLGAAELGYIVGHAAPRVLVADATNAPRVEALGVPIAPAETLAVGGSDALPAT